ncbi:MAG: transglutaminase family protein [Cryomorphaceae bacterium]|nr:transglutaminase family protein [Cryomorphaceae bacterium]
MKIALVFLACLVLLAFAFNGHPTVTKTDQTYIDSFLTEWKIPAQTDSIHASFDREVAFVSRVQDSIVKNFDGAFHPQEAVGNVDFYFRNRAGVCYDKAMLMEKIFSSYGFPIRHMYIYFRDDSTAISRSDFFKKGLTSHAMLEVETQKGWMTVATNGNWLGLDLNGDPLTIYEVRDQIKAGNLKLKKTNYYGIYFFEAFRMPSNFLITYGIYSRHGQFLRNAPVEKALNSIGIKSKLPDYNLRMLLYNF